MRERNFSGTQVVIFILILCSSIGFLLAAVAYSLRNPQKLAKEFDQSKQMLLAADILDKNATDEQIKQIAEERIRPLLTDSQGNVFTLEEKNINLVDYLASNTKSGYANLPLKLFYAILPDKADSASIKAADVAKDLTLAEVIVIPVSGFGLWAPIYGFIAIKPDGDTVVGTSWYDMAETPGLGANITEAWWQSQFKGKLIFHKNADGKTDFTTADIGIIVVKGKVRDVYGVGPRAQSAVDGISGATLTGNGVSDAYRDSLTPYRAFLLKLHELGEKSHEPKAAAA